MEKPPAPQSQDNLRLNERLALISDAALLEMVGKGSDEYTREARAMIDAEVSRRGGIDALKEKTKGAETSQPAGEDRTTVRRVFLVAVFAACALVIYLLDGSFWFYWVCLFALIASWFGVLFLPRHNPEDELNEMLSKAAQEQGTEDNESD